MKSSYELVKNFVKNSLEYEYNAKNGILEREFIKNKVFEAKKLSTNEAFAKALGLTQYITDDDCERMISEFETIFNVKMQIGVTIQGDEQRNRDTTWWRDRVKLELQKDGGDYYTARFKEFVSKKMPPSVMQTLDDDTDFVMNNIGNPSENKFGIFGMVVGHVQSGKTLNYSALICKAADAGYKFIVVIAGDKNNLRNQTQIRINEYFIGKDANNPIGVGLNEKRDISKNPISLTTQDSDFDKKVADTNSQGVNFDNIKSPIVLVIKKNSYTLKNVVKWLKNQYKNAITHPMLVIDDEADYASINTKTEDDPTKINALIRQLLGLFEKSSYVAYTATPFANIFINDDSAMQDELSKDLFPQDFIHALDAPSNYFGAQKIFLDKRENFVVEIDDFEDKIPFRHTKEFVIDELSLSLYEAVRVFCLNCAIRHLRGQAGHNSMLVHISRFTAVHHQIYLKINEYLEKIKADFRAYGKLENATAQSEIIREFYETFADKFEFEREFSVSDVILRLADIIHTITTKEEHSQSKLRIEYRKDYATNVIAVGGMALSRGFTLDGLSVSYFIKNTIFYDTLMQMGRWFGYRDGYEDLCKIYMPSIVSDNFAQIIEATNELMARFKDMANENKTPKDFGLRVKCYPDSLLQVTARNKMRNTQKRNFVINFCGLLRETFWIHKNAEIRNKNLETLKALVNKHTPKFNKKGAGFLARNVEKSEISAFLNDFKVVEKYSPLMPIEPIKSYVKEKETAWDILLCSGNGETFAFNEQIEIKARLRALREEDDRFELINRKVSSGNAEKDAISGDIKGEMKTEEIRKRLNNPLLMLHIIEVKNKLPTLKDDERIAAFGVCFPRSQDYESQSIDYVLNPVEIKQIQEYLEEEEIIGDDDE